MATTKLYLDTRANVPGIPVPIKISLCLNGKTALHSTGVKVLPEQWDKKTCKIIRHPQAMYLNTVITSAKNNWDISIIKLPCKITGVSQKSLMIFFRIYN